VKRHFFSSSNQAKSINADSMRYITEKTQGTFFSLDDMFISPSKHENIIYTCIPDHTAEGDNEYHLYGMNHARQMNTYETSSNLLNTSYPPYSRSGGRRVFAVELNFDPKRDLNNANLNHPLNHHHHHHHLHNHNGIVAKSVETDPAELSGLKGLNIQGSSSGYTKQMMMMMKASGLSAGREGSAAAMMMMMQPQVPVVGLRSGGNTQHQQQLQMQQIALRDRVKQNLDR
jgi:hypothetical protein